MDMTMIDATVLTAVVCVLGAVAAVAAAWRPKQWSFALTSRRIARVRANEVARATLGEATWDTFVRHGYIDLPSPARPDTLYRLRPAQRIEVRGESVDEAALGARDGACTRGYLCVYPTYELPAVEFLAQLYMRLRDDEERVLAVGQYQPRDGRIPNVF